MTAHRVDSEGAVLGAILLDGTAYWRVADRLGAEDFTRPDHAALWGIIAELARQNVPIDTLTIGEYAPQLLGLAADLVATTPSAANVCAYADLVADAATLRRVRNAGQRIAKLDGTQALGEAQSILQACAPRQLGTIKHAREFLRESQARMQTRVEAASELIGVPSGIPKLDGATGG